MSSYTISHTLNKSRVFILQKSELEKRFDPFFYVPELLELEKKVFAKKPKKLRDYVKGLASGATPKTTETEKYYAEKENGIPFLRVQNLSPTGILEFDDCKYINKETHNGMLKRSQVSAGDLLVKITGVGRMAVASVAPDGFEGNINQHVCVIKTGSKEMSEIISAFLNSDIGEKLASRRSTGGTRPALDYPALLSIPIIEDKHILQITEKVIAQKKKNEAEADKLLSSIDDYLLKELGIKLPEPPENTLKNRMFTTILREISGGRLDPNFHKKEFEELISAIKKVPFSNLKRIIAVSNEVWDQTSLFSSSFPYIEISAINTTTGEITQIVEVEKDSAPSRAKMIVRSGDILISTTRPNRGAITLYLHDSISIASTGFSVIRQKFEEKVNFTYLWFVLRSKISLKQMEQRSSGGNYPAITQEELENILIPLPTLDKQNEIAEHITGIRQQAQQLKDKTTELLKKASEEIEEILLN